MNPRKVLLAASTMPVFAVLAPVVRAQAGGTLAQVKQRGTLRVTGPGFMR